MCWIVQAKDVVWRTVQYDDQKQDLLVSDLDRLRAKEKERLQEPIKGESWRRVVFIRYRYSQYCGSGPALILASRIRIQKRKNVPQKLKKVKKFHVSKCWMWSFEG
jgi:hypothetical protein